jgi:hypothetical protein
MFASLSRFKFSAGFASPSRCAQRQGPLASDAACGHTVRSQSHGPNVMIIGWPGVPVLWASQACPSPTQWCVTGFRVANWCHGVAERSGPGFKSSRWFMFSRLKGLGTSSSHADGSRSVAAAAAAVTDGHILSHKSGSSPSRLQTVIQ